MSNTTFRIYSDLHGYVPEFTRDTDSQEYCIVAGDVDNFGKKGVKVAEILTALCKRFKAVIWVPGNHDYYGTSLLTAMRKVTAKVACDNFIPLQNGKTFTVGNVSVIGATLWSDTSQIFLQAKLDMNDYRYIRYGSALQPYSRVLTPQDTFALHVQHTLSIIEALAKVPEDHTSIVVTHHAPTMKSIDPKYADPENPYHHLNPAYATELDLPHWPDYWVHGHIHHAWDYLHKGCNIRTNPTGYSSEFFTGFEPVNNRIEVDN